jgi:hypothetical protein
MTAFQANEVLEILIIFIVAPIMIVAHGRRMIIEKAERGSVSIVKKIILIAFILEFLSGFSNFIFLVDWLPSVPPFRLNSFDDGLGINTIVTGLVVTIGLTLVVYMFNLERIQFTPAYVIAAIILYYFASGGHSELYPYYIYIGGVAGLLFMYLASFRLKDNFALGLSLFYTLTFLKQIVGMMGEGVNIAVPIVLTIIPYIFGLIFVSGHFKPFKGVQINREVKTPAENVVEVH